MQVQDNNLGLAKQVIESLHKRNIQRLTQTYLTLSLQDIADTVQLDGQKEAELRILQMVSLNYFPSVTLYTLQVCLSFEISTQEVTWIF